jgi:Fic family protein
MHRGGNKYENRVKADIEWLTNTTARKYLNSLQERNVLNSKKINKKNYWWIIVN